MRRILSPDCFNRILHLAIAALLLPVFFCARANAQTAAWPHPIPARVHDDDNKDLFVMTLGDVKTPLAQGVFDPAKDELRLNDGTVTANFFRDVRGVKYFKPLDKSRFPLPPSGWCTWYYYYAQVNEAEVKLNAKWIADNLKDFGAQYIQIDDGWQGLNRQAGIRDWTVVNKSRFPDGMDGLAKYIKSLGLTPGLWLAPHGQSSALVVSNHPNAFLLKADGSYDTDTRRWEGLYLVDPSTPETLKYYQDLFTTLTKWGYEYFKIDGQPDVAAEYRRKSANLRHPTDDTDALYRKTIETIKQTIGPDRYLLGCWGTPIEGVGIYDGSRTGGDIVLGWGGFQVALRATLQYYFLHNIAWYGDPDVMLVRSPMTLDQARVWATLQGLTGQALMGTDRMPDLSPDRVEIIKRVYPATDIRPLDLFPAERNKRVWDLKVHHLGRDYDVVGVFNFGEGRSEQNYLNWKELGLPTDKPVHVFDFWNQEYLGQWQAGMAVEVPPTSCRVLTLVPSDDRIQLISTSRHMTQGWVDLASLARNDADNSFKGASKLVKNDPYELRFAFPRGTNYMIKGATARGKSGKLPVKIVNHQGWTAVQFTSPANGDVNWEVQFAPSDWFHYPVAAPTALTADRAGLDGANLRWREQYYLNVGYQVYLDGKLQGYTPEAKFPLRGLDPRAEHTAYITTVWEDGRETGRSNSVSFNIEKMLPAEMPITQLQPVRSTASWRGFELEDSLANNPLMIAGQRYRSGLPAVVDSEIEYDLRGLFDKFTASVGLDDTANGTSAATFSVIGDGKELWHSGPITKSDSPKSASAEIKGVKKLLLRVTPEGTNAPPRRGPRDQADWVDVRLSRAANESSQR